MRTPDGPSDRRTPSSDSGAVGDDTPQNLQTSFGDWKITRRKFIATASVVTLGVAIGVPENALRAENAATQGNIPAGSATLELTINRQPYKFSLDPRVTLLDLLRENIGLTGTKKGCDHGQCGACTVLVNGRRINSCLSLAVAHDKDSVVTIEGLSSGQQLHPIQEAFLKHDGFQCGYCTPGQICSAVAMLDEVKNGDASLVTADLKNPGSAGLTPEEIRERMSGNICRCGAYPGIVEAITECAKARVT